MPSLQKLCMAEKDMVHRRSDLSYTMWWKVEQSGHDLVGDVFGDGGGGGVGGWGGGGVGGVGGDGVRDNAFVYVMFLVNFVIKVH